MPRAPGAEGESPGASPGRRWVPAAGIVAAVAAAYLNAFRAGFQFDDWNVIVDEPRVRSLAAWWAAMPGIRPILKLTYALQHAAGNGALGFHAVNVGVHAANACLVYAILRPLAARRVAFVASLIFALHPVQTEAVTYVSGRSTSLAAFFALASLWTWIAARGRGWMLWIASPALFVCAVLVKETALVLPLGLVLWDRTAPRPEASVRRMLPWAHFVLVAVLALAAAASPAYRRFFATSLETRGVGTNLLTQAHAVVYLAGQLVRFDRLNADPVLPVIERWDASVAFDALLVVSVLVAGAFWYRRRPAVGFGTLWFFLFLAPTNSFLPRLDVANDRQLYLSLVGPAWLLAWAAWAALPRRYVVAVSCAIALGLGGATHLRNRVYANEVVFWTDVTRKSPTNARAFNNLGYAYALDSRDDLAEAAFRQALRLDPDHWRAGVNLRLLHEGALRGARRNH